ncbi:M28 family metallopeptidase [Rapidithrix thailandica]|uniref:M28 family metallopeptidase n=1 Tax=Rapidithrix thailandica TaxID=413964 RepID=A0AAW9S081_9BACT
MILHHSRIIHSFMIATCCAFLQYCTPTSEQQAIIQIKAEDITQYLEPLASDEFQGRKPFTEGETKTIAFIKEAFEEMGLQPANGESYFQEVPLVEISGHPAPSMTVTGTGSEESLELEGGKDYIVFSEREQEDISLEASELVFCGFGIVAPEYGWNDYEGIDMKGKTAVVMVNDPGFGTTDSTLFKGNTMTYYGRWTYKYEEAARQGAEAVLIIHETGPAGYPWTVVQNSWSGAKLQLQSTDGNQSKCALQGWITLETASKLFKMSPTELGNITRKARNKGFKPVSLGLHASTSLKNTFKKDLSQNVVAMLPGTELKDEYIIYTAHWDHLGVGTAVDGDSIYNGAVDNASGTASIMAIANAFSQQKEKNKRSLVFLMVTAEEQGLLGSAYYAQHPLFPPEKTVANLNIDAMNPNGAMKDFTITGYGHSELDEYAAEAAQKQGRYILPDQSPEKGYFFRSDHFNFAKIGIPALYGKGGYDHLEKGKDYAMEKHQEFTATRYHRPSDEFNSTTWDMSGLVQDAQLYYEIGLKLAHEKTFPKWKEGSEFKAKRENLQ